MSYMETHSVPNPMPQRGMNERLQAEIEKRLQADRCLAERTRRLQRVTSRLTQTLRPAEVAEVIIDEGATAVEAKSAAVWSVDEGAGRLLLLHSRGYGEAAKAWVESMPLVSELPIGEAVVRGEPVWIGSVAEYAARYPMSEKRTR